MAAQRCGFEGGHPERGRCSAVLRLGCKRVCLHSPHFRPYLCKRTWVLLVLERWFPDCLLLVFGGHFAGDLAYSHRAVFTISA